MQTIQTGDQPYNDTSRRCEVGKQDYLPIPLETSCT